MNFQIYIFDHNSKNKVFILKKLINKKAISNNRTKPENINYIFQNWLQRSQKKQDFTREKDYGAAKDSKIKLKRINIIQNG